MAKTPVRRLIEQGIEAGADYIPDVIETPLRRAFSIDVPKTKARKPKASLAVDPKQKATKAEKPLTAKQFERNYLQHIDLRNRKGKAEEAAQKIKTEGFKPGAGMNLMNVWRGGKPRNIMQDRFLPRKDDVVYLVPKSAQIKMRGYGEKIAEGWKPAPHEVHTISETGQDMYQAYLDKFAAKTGAKAVDVPPSLEEPMRDQNFQRFFEGSKAVDEHGEPLRLYHGTGSDVKDFNAPAFLTPDISGAEWYAMNRGDNPNIMPVYLGAKNIFDARGEQGMMRLIDAAKRAQIPVNVSRDDYGWSFESPRISEVSSYGGDSPLDLLYAPEMREQLQKEGFDAVRAWDALSNSDIEAYVALQPTQIKSAIGNRGTYDPDAPDINMARGGLAVKSRKYAVKRKRK